MKKLSKKEKLDLFKVEELESRLEMKPWIDTVVINGGCTMN